MGFWDDVSKGVTDAAKAAKEAADDAAKVVGTKMAEQEKINQIKREESMAFEAKMKDLAKGIIVTTGDLRQEYEIIRPIFFHVSNKGFFCNNFNKLVEKYKEDIKELELKSIGGFEIGMRLFLGEFSVGEDDFQKAFFIVMEELKRKAITIGADAIIHMRQDVDIETHDFQFFYLQMYGTAVKLKK